MIGHVREGDTVVVASMDRMAHSVMDLNQIVKELVGKGVVVAFLQEGISFRPGDSDPYRGPAGCRKVALRGSHPGTCPSGPDVLWIMTSNYVRGSAVSCSASQAEIELMLTGHGAYGFRCASEPGKAVVAFSSDERRYRLVLSLLGPGATPPGPRGASPGQGRSLQGSKSVQEVARRRWRQLSSLIRAKFEAIDSGIVTFDEEFLAYMVMPDGGTVLEESAPRIAVAYEGGGGRGE
jgi:hypothetical protein